LKNVLREIDFYLVTDSRLTRKGVLDDVGRALEAGCRIVQYREKEKSTREMVEEALRVGELCRGRAVFLVNDRVDVALAVGADGVHIGQDDMPCDAARRLLGADRIIGVTVHDVAEAVEAERLGADYVGLSPIFETGTKKDAGKACGVSMVRMVRERVSLPVVAIGGINMENVAGVIRAGADAAAAISAVVCADDVRAAVAGFVEAVRKAKTG